LRFVVKSYVELLFPSIGLLADVLDRCSDDVPPAGDAGVQVVAVVELGLRVEVVLDQRFLVGL
jgi:putative IMPACT (imprinted ancient) family translation regulator